MLAWRFCSFSGCDSWDRWVQWSTQRWNAFLGWHPAPSGFWHQNFSECSFTFLWFSLALCVILLGVGRFWFLCIESESMLWWVLMCPSCVSTETALAIAFSLCHDDKLLWNLSFCEFVTIVFCKKTTTVVAFSVHSWWWQKPVLWPFQWGCLKALMVHEQFGPYGWEGPFEPHVVRLAATQDSWNWKFKIKRRLILLDTTCGLK